MNNAFIDLDELILLCRDKSSRKFIQEAIACYRAGAFRSCIVATWNAVVFDFLHKLRELELFGDGEATQRLKEFEKLRKEELFKELWIFEADIPKIACEKFELISSVEQSDIERLFQDRSRCAHPSMTSLDEPFEATAELARYHLRSAITHLLQHPPVQGRAAKEKIFVAIKSEYFPIDPESAIQYFQKSPLARARFILIKDVVIGLTKSLLLDDCPKDERDRQFSALTAVSSMYPEKTREVLNDKLSDIILNRTTDANWDKTIIYLGSILAWDTLSEACRLKAKAYINKVKLFEEHKGAFPRPMLSQDNLLIMIKACHIDFLKETIVDKFKENKISVKNIFSFKESYVDRYLKDQIIIDILKALSPQATLDELLLMISKPSLESDKNIRDFLTEKVTALNLIELAEMKCNYLCKGEFVISLVEGFLRKKIPTEKFENLIEAKSICKDRDKLNPDLIEIFDSSIIRCLNNVTSDDLLDQKKNWDVVPKEFLKPVLKDNIQIVTQRFAESVSFVSAGKNANLLLEISEYLILENWEYILNAYFDNNQIYNSWYCLYPFEQLFKKSVEINGIVQSYWVEFRKKLNNPSNQERENIKKLIDSYISESRQH